MAANAKYFVFLSLTTTARKCTSVHLFKLKLTKKRILFVFNRDATSFVF